MKSLDLPMNSDIIKKFEENYRVITGEGHSTFVVKRVNHFSKVKAKTLTENVTRGYGYYGRNWIYVNATHYIFYCRNSLPLIVDGIMNLYSKKYKKINVAKTFRDNEFYTNKDRDIELVVYEAIWIRQGRGTHISTEKGFIGKSGNIYYHAETVDKAVKGVWNKLKTKQIDRRYREKQKKLNEKRFKSYFDSIPEDMTLSLQDSIDSGNCMAGTLNSINRNSLNRHKKYPARLIYKLAVKRHQGESVKRIISWKMRINIPAPSPIESKFRKLIRIWFKS
jgi:hypothetical protein